MLFSVKHFFCLSLVEVHLDHFLKIKSLKEVTNPLKSRVFLLFLLDDRRTRSRTRSRNSDYWIPILEARKTYKSGSATLVLFVELRYWAHFNFLVDLKFFAVKLFFHNFFIWIRLHLFLPSSSVLIPSIISYSRRKKSAVENVELVDTGELKCDPSLSFSLSLILTPPSTCLQGNRNPPPTTPPIAMPG